MTDIDNLLHMLGVDKLSSEKQEKVKELLKKIISKHRAGNDEGAYSILNSMLTTLNCDTLPESVITEVKDNLWSLISKEAGYSVKDFLWKTGGAFNNPNISDIKETTAAGDIVGKDSNRFTDAYKRVLAKDGLFRQKPRQRDLDDEEDEVIDKLKKLKKLFQGRNAKDISIDDIKKVLTQESREQQLSALQYLKEAQTMLNDQNTGGANEKQI